jgi:hypothetical protein
MGRIIRVVRQAMRIDSRRGQKIGWFPNSVFGSASGGGGGGSYSPSLDFSDARNSQYLGIGT